MPIIVYLQTLFSFRKNCFLFFNPTRNANFCLSVLLARLKSEFRACRRVDPVASDNRRARARDLAQLYLPFGALNQSYIYFSRSKLANWGGKLTQQVGHAHLWTLGQGQKANLNPKVHLKQFFSA